MTTVLRTKLISTTTTSNYCMRNITTELTLHWLQTDCRNPNVHIYYNTKFTGSKEEWTFVLSFAFPFVFLCRTDSISNN